MTHVLLKILLASAVLSVLHQLLTGKAYGGGPRIIRRRMSELPETARWGLWGWQVFFYREEWPGAWWATLVVNCLFAFGLALGIAGKFPKLPPQETLVRPFLEFCGGFAAVGIVMGICSLFWGPSRSGRKVWGIGSPRTVGFYVACVLSLPVALILSIRSNWRLGFLLFIPYGLLSLGHMSGRIDAGKSAFPGPRV